MPSPKHQNRILHINSIYLNATFIYYLISNFDLNRHFFLVKEIKRGDKEKFPFENVIKISKFFHPLWLVNKFIAIKFGFRLVRFSFPQVLAARKLKNIDLIHAHFGNEGYYTMSLSKFLKVPLVVTFYGGDMSDIPNKTGWMKRYSKLFCYADLFFVEGEFMKMKLAELGCPLNKIVVSKLPIPIDNIEFSYRPNYINCLNVLMCASMVEKKGYFDALNTLKLLKDEGISIKCDIIGSGKLLSKIVEMIAFYDLQSDVRLLGRMNPKEIYILSKNYHVFFHPSKFDANGGSEGGAPTIISEMQALGLPIIATKHADIPNVIPEKNHFLAEEGNVLDLLGCFKKFISLKNEWNDISDRGLFFVKKNHYAPNVSNKMEHIYNEVIEGYLKS